jgi:hypothetical protein
MSYIDQRGHRVPSPTDPAQRADITALSLSIPSIRTVVSETAAAQYVAALQGAGVQSTETDPAFVYRLDTGNIQSWDGRVWADVTGKNYPWETLPMSTGWGVGGGHTPRICMRGGVVYLSGAVITAGGSHEDILTIPSKFRPSREQFIGASITANGADFDSTYAELRVTSYGKLAIKDYSTVRMGHGWIIPLSASYVPW